MASGEIQHSTLGRVTVNLRTRSNSITARWKNGVVNVNVPHGVDEIDLHRILDDMTPRLLAARPNVTYFEGMTMTFPHWQIVIGRQPFAPGKMLGKASLPTSSIEVGTDYNFDAPETTRAISDMLCKIAYRVAPQLLIPRAREIATRIGRQPMGWTISKGHRVLGQCSTLGVISLSYVLVFLPEELRDYVICHEIAHLTEMNHSTAFHHILNGYLDGREEELVARLHSHRWPVFRK
jgi:hypothetical protein